MSDLPPETPELLLRDILDLPFPSELQAAPRGDRVAWVTNERGCRNVWLAVAGDTSGEWPKPMRLGDVAEISTRHISGPPTPSGALSGLAGIPSPSCVPRV